MPYPTRTLGLFLGAVLSAPGTERPQEAAPPVPQTYRMGIIAKPVLSTTALCNLMHIGDSRANNNSTGGSNLVYGIQRSWPLPIAGRQGNLLGGSSNWSTNAEQFPSANQTFRKPGDTFYDGTSGNNPIGYFTDAQFTGNVADGAARILAVALCGLNDYALGDWVDGRPIRCRVQWIANTKNLPGNRNISGYRGGVFSEVPASSADTAVDLSAGTPGFIYSAEVNCGTSSRSAAFRVGLVAGQDESAANHNCANFGDCLFWDTDATHGLVLSSVGTTNYTQADVLAGLGGGGSPTCTTANAAAYLKNLVVPNCPVVIILEVINLSSAEGADFATGSFAVFQANREAIIAQLQVIAVINGWDMTILNRTGPTGLLGGLDEPTINPTYNTLRARALYAATVSRPFCAYSNDGGLMTCRGVVGGADHTSTLRERAVETYDGLHMTGGPANIREANYDINTSTIANAFAGNGDVSWAYPLWCEIVAAGEFLTYQPSSRVYRSRSAG